MGLLDTRFCKTSSLYEISKASVKLDLTSSPPSSYYKLEPFETAYIEGTIGPSDYGYIPIETDPDVGQYVMILTEHSSGNANMDFRLEPNNTSYSSVYTHSSFSYYYTSTTEQFQIQVNLIPIPYWTDVEYGVSDTPPVIIYALVSTEIYHKSVLYMIGDYKGNTSTMGLWNDTTTPWTKFGRIQFTDSTTQTNPHNIKIFIRRII